MKKQLFIIITAYSPDKNIIASVRPEKLAKYISLSCEVVIVGGLEDQLLNSSLVADRGYKLINVPAKSFAKDSGNTGVSRLELMGKSIFRKLKAELLPLIELIFPISPGGMVLHDEMRFVYEASKIMKEHKDKEVIIFCSFGPHFIFRVGKKLKKKFPSATLIVDYRDWAWLYGEGKFYSSIVWKKITKKMLETCDASTFVAKGILEKYTREFKLNKNNVHFLPNGFDVDDIPSEQSREASSRGTSAFEGTITYTGSFHNETRNPTSIFLAAELLAGRGFKLSFNYAGKDGAYLRMLSAKSGSSLEVRNYGFLPRAGSVSLQRSAELLLLIAYSGNNPEKGASLLTGKVYEYIFAKRPMLVIAPANWELRELVESDGVSRVLPANDLPGIADYIYEFFTENLEKSLLERDRAAVSEFSYSSISEKLIRICGNLKT